MNKRIFITGASGIGKTTIAKILSEKYGIPYISSSASMVWDKYGFKDHAEAHRVSVLNPGIGLSYQRDILALRKTQLVGDSWVTDRSPMDNIAYMLLTLNHALPPETVYYFMVEALEMMSKSTCLIHLKWDKHCTLEDNGKRIINPYYQGMVDAIITHVIENTKISYEAPVLEIKVWDLKQRLNIIDSWLDRLHS